jgi:hypothetical protein
VSGFPPHRNVDRAAKQKGPVCTGPFRRRLIVVDRLIVALLAGRIVASWRNEFVEHRLGEAEPFLDVGDNLHHLGDEIALFVLRDFGDEVGADGLPVLVERDFSVRRIKL